MPASVLIVDDSPTIRGFAKIFLKPLQVEVSEAEEGLQALEIVRRAPPAVVIVDINMPGMDGLTFTREVRADSNAAIAKLPVILLTGDRSDDMKQKGREAGATDFLEKPIKGAELQALVKKFIGAWSPERSP